MLKLTLWDYEPITRSSRHQMLRNICDAWSHRDAGDQSLGQSPPPGALSTWVSLLCPGRAKVLRKAPMGLLDLRGAQCSQGSLRWGAFWGACGCCTASFTNYIPAASRTQTALTVIGSSAWLPEVSLRNWLGYQSTFAGPASILPTRCTQVGLPYGPEPPCLASCAETELAGWALTMVRSQGAGVLFLSFFFKGECP